MRALAMNLQKSLRRITPTAPQLPKANAKTYLFVGGCARSGTTAFVQLLNAHSEIFIGNERYLYLYPRIKEAAAKDNGYFNTERFKPERFSLIHPGETFWNDISDMDSWEQ